MVPPPAPPPRMRPPPAPAAGSSGLGRAPRAASKPCVSEMTTSLTVSLPPSARDPPAPPPSPGHPHDAPQRIAPAVQPEPERAVATVCCRPRPFRAPRLLLLLHLQQPPQQRPHRRLVRVYCPRPYQPLPEPLGLPPPRVRGSPRPLAARRGPGGRRGAAGPARPCPLLAAAVLHEPAAGPQGALDGGLGRGELGGEAFPPPLALPGARRRCGPPPLLRPPAPPRPPSLPSPPEGCSGPRRRRPSRTGSRRRGSGPPAPAGRTWARRRPNRPPRSRSRSRSRSLPPDPAHDPPAASLACLRQRPMRPASAVTTTVEFLAGAAPPPSSPPPPKRSLTRPTMTSSAVRPPGPAKVIPIPGGRGPPAWLDREEP